MGSVNHRFDGLDAEWLDILDCEARDLASLWSLAARAFPAIQVAPAARQKAPVSGTSGSTNQTDSSAPCGPDCTGANALMVHSLARVVARGTPSQREYRWKQVNLARPRMFLSAESLPAR